MSESTAREPVLLDAGEGRAHPIGRLSAVFKADGDETDGPYLISDCWRHNRDSRDADC